MLLIGSHALNYRLGKIREPVDIDYIGTFEELVEYQKKHKESIESIVYESDKKVIIKRKDCIVEFEVAYEGESGFDALSFGGEKILFDGTVVTVPDINVLFEIKSSHRYLKDSPHFLKTMNDRVLLKEAGAQITNKEFLSKREKETYTYKHPKLNVNRCTACMTNCRSCLSGTTCDRCESGYKLNDAKTKCVLNCDDNCLTCL